MPEYLAPGVFVEETHFRGKNIEGVSTSITGFIGQCCYGPVNGIPAPVNSLNEYKNKFGGFEPLTLNGVVTENYLTYSVKSFFDNGGKRLYISRIYHPSHDTGDLIRDIDADRARGIELLKGVVRFKACFPGAIGNTFKLYIEGMRSGNLLRNQALIGLNHGDVVEVVPDASGPKNLSITESGQDALSYDHLYVARVHHNNPTQIELLDRNGHTLTNLDHLHSIQKITQTVVVDALGFHERYEALSCFSDSDRFIGNILKSHDYNYSVDSPGTENNTVFLEIDELPVAEIDKLTFTLDLFSELMSSPCNNQVFSHGKDGEVCIPEDYQGRGEGGEASGLKALVELDDISVVAAPGSSALPNLSHQQEIRKLLITHCEKLRYRFVILSAQQDADLSDVRKIRSEYDSSYAALYYPWLVVDSARQDEHTINIPPEGAIAGIYARTDIERGVHNAPANEVVRGIQKFSLDITRDMQEILNPEGINCLTDIAGRGYRVWGARTMSSDPEWKYVSVRRLLIFLEHSIQRGTEWAVFEPVGQSLFQTIRMSIGTFLVEVWRSGALMGATVDEAFFVRCDKTTMTQTDIDNGRLVCVIGIAPTKPAEFVVFRIGQWTADANA